MATMDPFFEIETFVAVVEAGSLSGAADRLNVVKSVVSRRLKTLESRLGTPLMTRTTRRQSLTEAGKVFYDRCVNLLADLESAEEAVTEQEETLRGRLRIAAPQSLGLLQVVPAVLEFMTRHPELLIDLDLNDRRVDLVGEGFDMAIRLGVLADSSLRARRLASLHMVLCASPDYLARFGTPKTPDDLKDHQCIRYNQVSNINVWHYRGPDRQLGHVRVPIRALSSSGEFIRDAAILGLGVDLAPTFLVAEALRAGTLVPMLTDYEWYESALQQNMYAVFPPTQHLSRRVRVFTDFLAERLKD